MATNNSKTSSLVVYSSLVHPFELSRVHNYAEVCVFASDLYIYIAMEILTHDPYLIKITDFLGNSSVHVASASSIYYQYQKHFYRVISCVLYYLFQLYSLYIDLGSC